MKTIGVFEAKVRFSEICQQVVKHSEPVMVTRRGVPLVRIDPVERTETKSAIWEAADEHRHAAGRPAKDLTLPARVLKPRRREVEL
jgi:prevent-host-death family protein